MVQIVTNSNWWGGGNKNAVIWPSSAVDWDIVIFDWDTWKIIKDSWEKLSNLQVKWIEVNVATASWTAAKVWTTTAGNYTPTVWDFLLVNFVNGCSVASPTLNIDWSGAKAIRTGNAAATTGTFALWTTANSNIKALLYYDWTYYRCWSTTNSNTTYSAMSVSEWQAGTATSQRSMRADYLKQIIKYHAVDNSRLSDDWYNGTAIAPSQASVYYEFAKRELQAWTDLEIVWISSHNLPEWYTELSFLWWSGSWYINTWNILQCKDTIKIKFKRPTATTPSSTQGFFGSLQGSSNVPRSNIWFRTNWYLYWWVNQTVDFAPIDANIHTIEVWYDWVDYYYKYDNWAKTTYTPTSTTDPSINAYLFARNWSTVAYSWWIRIYYLEWYREDWTEVAHLIPAQRDEDWVLWMYDLVSDTFLAPAWSGTWSWEPLGNVINFTNDSGYITSADLSWYQTIANLVTSLSWADDTHYPSAKAVADAITSAWGWDMLKSVYDPNNCAKDAFNYCNMYNQPTIPTVCNVLNSSCTNQALSAKQGCVLNSCVSDINWKIPSAATTTNQLADKDYVNDSINSVAAYYITKNAAGDQWATYAELAAATTFYSGWVVRTPTRNDYTVVLDDENHDNATTRYSYQGSWWQYQYTINETPLTQAQLDALNSWITAAKVSSYDGAVSTIGWYWDIVSCNASCFATASQWWKADTALQPWANISCLNNNSWFITWVAWGGITWCLTNQTDLCWALWGKACDSCVVHLSWAETICWTKTFCTSPVVPSKTAAATNTGTAIATEAQVYSVKQSIPTNNSQLSNGCWYTTCTWTLTQSAISDTAFWASWDADTTHAPSKNAIYDVLWDVETLLANL